MTSTLGPGSWNIQTSAESLRGFTMGEELADMAEHRDDIVVLTADLMFSNGTNAFRERFPDRFINTGIAEQNMMGIAAGLAACGFLPYVATFASFASLLCAEHARTDLAYTQMPVRIIAHHAGISMGFYGTSHHAVEDIALMRAIAGMTVVSPCDGAAVRAILRATVDTEGPVYIRVGRGLEKQVYDDIPTFEFGRFVLLREGKDVTIIGTGLGVQASLDAAKLLKADGVSARVLDAVFLKPLDREAVLLAAEETGAIVTVEEHNPNGGLGGAVAEVLAESGVRVPFRRHSLPDVYSLVAPPTHLYRHYGLTGDGVASAVRDLLGVGAGGAHP